MQLEKYYMYMYWVMNNIIAHFEPLPNNFKYYDMVSGFLFVDFSAMIYYIFINIQLL